MDSQNYLLVSPRFQENNLINAINIFLNNGYPLQFIFSTIHNRIKFHNKIITININKVKDKFLPFHTLKLFLKNFHCLQICSIAN